MKRKFVIDEEISFVKENDILKTQVYADNLVEVINNAPENKVFTIGLFGNWGSGKSSIVKTAKDMIEANDDKVKFITYDAWKYVNDSFRRMFLLKIQQELKQGQTEVMQRFYQSESIEAKPKTYVSTNGLVIICFALLASLVIIQSLPIAIECKAPIFSAIPLLGILITIFGSIFQKLKIQINKPMVFAPEQFEECFREMISKALIKRNIINNACTRVRDYVELGECSIMNLTKLVIVIDNIDRCHNEMAYQLLTDIKTFLSDEKLNVVFVIPVDDEALKRNLFSNNDCTKEKEEFLRKFFNVTIRIKPHQATELQTYARELNNRNNLGFNADTLALCCKEFATNPRRIIQLFNNLSSELSQYSSEFSEKNESAICAILILREEYPVYYNRVVDNPYIFKNNISVDDLDYVSSFMRFVAPIARDIAISDLLRILTNSDAIFDIIPETIRKSVNSYNAEETIKYIDSTPELKKEVFSLLKKNIENDIKSNSRTQIINSLEFISTISVSIEFEQVFLKEIDILYQTHYDNLLEQIDKNKLENLCRLAVQLDDNGFKDLKTYIIKHVTNIGEESENIDEYFIKAVFTVFNTDSDCELLRDFTTKLFSKVDLYTDIKYSATQLNNLLSEELVQSHINAIIIGENKETKNLLWLFEHKNNIEGNTYSLLFDKIQKLKSNTNFHVNYITYTTKFMGLIGNRKITNTKNLSNLNIKLGLENMYSNILANYKNDLSSLHNIIDYIIHVYRISNSLASISQNFIESIWTYDKNYIYSKLIDLKGFEYDLKPFHKYIMKDNDYSSNKLILLTGYCLLLKNETEEFVIDKTLIKSKIKSLLDNIDNAEIYKLIEQLIADNLLKELVTENITSRDSEYINKLPNILLELAINSFTEDTVSLYEDNMDFLAVIASNGSTEQENILVRILTGKINNKKSINETFSILKILQLEKDHNKGMICGALKSYKDSSNETDIKIDELIEKFQKNN